MTTISYQNSVLSEVFQDRSEDTSMHSSKSNATSSDASTGFGNGMDSVENMFSQLNNMFILLAKVTAKLRDAFRELEQEQTVKTFVMQKASYDKSIDSIQMTYKKESSQAILQSCVGGVSFGLGIGGAGLGAGSTVSALSQDIGKSAEAGAQAGVFSEEQLQASETNTMADYLHKTSDAVLKGTNTATESAVSMSTARREALNTMTQLMIQLSQVVQPHY